MTANDYNALHHIHDWSRAPWEGRLNAVKGDGTMAAWVAPVNSGIDKIFWQIDLLVIHEVTAIAVQGRNGYDDWVITFELSLSNDTFDWRFVKDSTGTKRVSTHLGDLLLEHL